MTKYCESKGIALVFSHVNEQPMAVMEKAGFVEKLGRDHFRKNIDEALEYAGEIESRMREK